MEAKQTWRDLLGQIINDPHERNRIADALDVNPITLTRWVANKSNPRQDNLRPLLDALPYYRVQLIDLISEEFPHFFDTGPSLKTNLQEIPSTFYACALNTYASSPRQVRSATVGLLVIQQILTHFDPLQQGLLVVIAQCVTPARGCRVRSLRQTLSRSTMSWGRSIEHTTMLFGAESQMGHTLVTRHPIVLQSHVDKMRLFPDDPEGEMESIAVYPLLLADSAAGAFCVASTQKDYFTQFHLDLLQCYTNLFVLAFENCDFYDLKFY